MIELEKRILSHRQIPRHTQTHTISNYVQITSDATELRSNYLLVTRAQCEANEQI